MNEKTRLLDTDRIPLWFRHWVILLGLFLIVIPFAGCPAGIICVRPISTTPDSFILNLSHGSSPRSCKEGPVYVQQVKFLRQPGRESIWLITATKSNATLETVEYGITPDGYSGTQAENLQSGDNIEVFVSGSSLSGGTRLVLAKDAER